MKRLACVIILAAFVFGLAMPKQSEANDVCALLGGLFLGAIIAGIVDEDPAPAYACETPAPVYVSPQPIRVYADPHLYSSPKYREEARFRNERGHSPPPQHRRGHRR